MTSSRAALPGYVLAGYVREGELLQQHAFAEMF
jgi:hypothetical protein